MTGTVPIPDRLARHGDRPAIVEPAGVWSFGRLDLLANDTAVRLLAGRDDLGGDRVAVLAEPGHRFVTAAFGAWRAGGVVVPMLPSHPEPELRFLLDDAGADVIVVTPSHARLAHDLADGREVVVVHDDRSVFDGRGSGRPLPTLTADRPALMIHTSGTTGRPKGVLHTHASIAAQVDAMIDAWGWTGDDRTILVLPLNHVHGLVNVTLTALAVGAISEAPGSFVAAEVWDRFASGEITVFMAVPTVYARLVTAWEAADEPTRQRWSLGARELRLMVCGSAALPVATLARWRELTGHTLLERYGMSELGMTLSNTLERREPGHVGWPFPGVEVRIVDDHGDDVATGQSGELLVRGPNVFREYWGRPDATSAAFVDGWFKTGDVAIVESEGYRLLGRSSVDIIKSGGEKISAIEIEETFRQHPAVADLAVVGIPDDEWGERVAAAVVAGPGPRPDPDGLRAWGKKRLAAAKVPTRWLIVDDLPRNTLGKVVKPTLREWF
ncbi:MAG: acyl-CoA synthetase [Desertimonas sp.]